VDELYVDIATRVQNREEVLSGLVDKHLFLHSAFADSARRAGFREVSFVPLASREFYRERFIDELLLERGISDTALAREANSIYGTIFHLFDAESYGLSAAAFIQLVLRA
jgi:hypothetical protein